MTDRPTVQLLVAAISLALAGSVSAATFNVTTNADSGSGSLRHAVTQANTTAGPDQISFAAGLGTITLTTGQIDITGALSIAAPAAGQTISGNNSSRIFGVITAGQPLSLENLILVQGYTSEDGASPVATCASGTGEGGAVCTRGELKLRNSTVSGNRTAGMNAPGGGLYVGNGSATLTNSTLSGNSTAGSTGSGGGMTVNGNAILINSTVSGNSIAGTFAIGGGLCVTNGNATMTNSTLSGNVTTGVFGRGGGLFVSNNVTLINSTVSGNSASGDSAPGGGLFVYSGSASLINSTLTGNSSAFGAGGVELYGYNSAALNLQSSVLAGNSGPEGNLGTFSQNGTSSVDVSHSLFGDSAAEVNGANTANIFSDAPGLLPLADQGCATPAGAPGTAACVMTHALNAGSAAIDTGANPLGLSTDERGTGFPRTSGVQTDIGAFESPGDLIFANDFE